MCACGEEMFRCGPRCDALGWFESVEGADLNVLGLDVIEAKENWAVAMDTFPVIGIQSIGENHLRIRWRTDCLPVLTVGRC